MFSADDIADYLTEELHNILTPLTLDAREEYLVFHQDITVLPDQELYPIPGNSVGTGLRDVVFVDTSGNERKIPYLSLDQKASQLYIGGYGSSPGNMQGTVYHYLQGNFVVIFPKPTTEYTIRFK